MRWQRTKRILKVKFYILSSCEIHLLPPGTDADEGENHHSSTAAAAMRRCDGGGDNGGSSQMEYTRCFPACSKSKLVCCSALPKYLYFHDSNEVVIHFSVKLMMLQISSTYLKR